MKRVAHLLVPLLCAGFLAGCGSLNAAPTPGELLDAPTTLNVGGSTVTAQAVPALKGNVFNVRIVLRSAKTLMPSLIVKDVYVVTNEGVWQSSTTKRNLWKCSASCAVAVGRGPANGVQPGDAVQVVLGVQDEQGRELLLRDEQAQVK